MAGIAEEDRIYLENQSVATSHYRQQYFPWMMSKDSVFDALFLATVASSEIKVPLIIDSISHVGSFVLSLLLADGLTGVFLENRQGPETWIN